MKNLFDFTSDQIKYKNFSEEVRLLKETKAGASYSKYTCLNKNGVTFQEVPGLVGLVGAAVMGYVNGDRSRPVIIGPATKPTIIASSFGGKWYGNRALISGGYDNITFYNAVEYFAIPSLSDSANFGSLLAALLKAASCSNNTRGVMAGGTNSTPASVNTIQYNTFATAGNAISFGSLVTGRTAMAACSNGSRGVFQSVRPGGLKNMEYVTIATLANSSQFGDNANDLGDRAGASNGIRGIFAGGIAAGVATAIDYFSIASVADSVLFGDLQTARSGLAGVGNSVYCLFAGGGTSAPAYFAVIERIATATLSNSSTFGNLTATKVGVVGVHNETRAVFTGGYNGTNTSTIEYTSFSTTGVSANFGNLQAARYHAAGTSGD